MNRGLVCVLLTLGFSGCLDAGSSQGPPPQPDLGIPDRVFHRFYGENCQQLHESFPTPSNLVAERVPKGFELVTDDPLGLVTTVTGIVSYCQYARIVAPSLHTSKFNWAEFSLGIRVRPPTELRAQGVVDLVPIVLHSTNPTVLEVLARWGLGEATRLSILEMTRPPPPLQDLNLPIQGVIVRNENQTYVQQVSRVDQTTAFGGQVLRWWGVRDGEATGAVRVELGRGQSVGLGTVSNNYVGPAADAPPSTYGTVQSLRSIHFNFTQESLGASISSLGTLARRDGAPTGDDPGKDGVLGVSKPLLQRAP